ncbi:D-Ala-D-Ala carboxypeptidase family metallohydrolase [Micromonospora chalcea]|uniref:D-Ala-D-Ala carboxypeptidase family metallohydrolase n=1 Tax=Micromonospora chalcea TaxID=1874 RepID=UPI0023790220|nr:D-Ala-D-Ala carboxypeptidase family metallohydrolase [Micromonospora chalcea]WDP99442.1 D-Ala-D-Ala carboxypeptidase family metallohydrolase [Micromonospora chalcea]
MRVNTLKRAAVAFALALPGAAVATVVAVPPAHADGCYTWNRTLSQGSSGDDVRQLQIRVAGWAAYGGIVRVDGVYGPETAAAVKRFQTAYGLRADGVAGPQTFARIYDLQKDSDCTPKHFSYAELDNGCGKGGWAGGPLSASATRENALRTMWKLEALRRSLGDKPLYVTSGFRSIACNRQVGGAADSQHLYGNAADLIAKHRSLCDIARSARSRGFSGIYGPGYPDHDDHTHVDSRRENNRDKSSNTKGWSAPDCGVK